MERKDHYFTKGSMYRLIPTLIKPVFPGERVEINLRGTLESDVIAALRAPAVVSSYAFYVPNRLVWDDWVEFICDPDTAKTIPTVNFATNQFEEIGELAGTLVSLARRALKLTYNEFFGDDSFGTHAWYSDPTADTAQNSMLPLKTVNQLLSSIALDTDQPNDNYTVVSNTIELTEFRRRLKVNARQNKQRVGGEKYVDALRRYGVDLREDVTSRPELLHRSSEVVYPQEVFNTSDTGLGDRVGRFRVAVNFATKRKFCMEHGHILVFHCLKPLLARALGAPFDRTLASREVFMEEQQQPFREISSLNVGTATDVEPDPLYPTQIWNNLGDMYTLNGVDGTLLYASNAALANLVYPSVTGDPKVYMGVSVQTRSVR